jgi:hypothetical protein
VNDSTSGLALLRKPFPEHQISYLPKGGVKLAYIGHAALTDRLLDADPTWNWEPLAMTPDGLPVLDVYGGMWIKLTVCGITRMGYGDAQGKEGPNAIKEVIGDALRNAAMRFGAGLELWHKGDLHKDESEALSEEALLELLRAAALNGMAALKEAYSTHLPTDVFWKKHSASLRLAAQKADHPEQPLRKAA